MTQAHTHSTHPAIIKRLRRALGHLERVIAMMEEERTCLDIAQQLLAVERAVNQAKRALIQDHLDNCLAHVVGPLQSDQQEAMTEFKEITRYL